MEGDRLTLAVVGEARDLPLETLRLCSEGLPHRVDLVITVTGAECPELLAQGPAGNALSRGRVCEELNVRVRDFELGVPAAARGSSSALVAYSRYQTPEVTLSTGDTGSGNATGSIVIEELHQTPDGRYRIRFTVSLPGDPGLSAAGATTIAPVFCMGA